MGIKQDSVVTIVNTYYCDRCGKIGEEYPSRSPILAELFLRNHPNIKGTNTCYRLCEFCHKETVALLKAYMIHA